MNKINYQLQLDKIIQNITKSNIVPTLFLHSCCAPCSSYTLEYLSQYFSITVFYYNPNIYPRAEFDKRFAEQQRLINSMSFKNSVSLVCGNCDYNEFLQIATGLEDAKEGGERCFKCYNLRLEQTAKMAKEQGFDYFCTTLSISPLKNSQKLNEIGISLGEKYGISYLPSDFKKREGYKRSIELSRQYDLYRQSFCGCVFSKSQAKINTNI